MTTGNAPAVQKDYPHIRELARLLNREVCFLDTETTGLVAPIALVEFACLSFLPDGRMKKFATLVNPGDIEIHWAAAKTHGITKKQVQHLQTFEKVVPVLNYIAEKTVLSGFNTRLYDVPVIQQNYARYQAGQFTPALQLDMRDIWTAINRGSNKGKLEDLAVKYGVIQGGAHRALADVVTTIDILEEMIARHGMEVVLSVYARQNARTEAEGRRQAQAVKEVMPPASPSSQAPASPPVKDAAPVLRNTTMAEAGQHILDLVKKNGRVLPGDYAAIARATSRTPQQVASKVSTMFESGMLSAAQVEDASLQVLIARHIDVAIAEVGPDKMRPIKEHLDFETGTTIDYVQLKIALAYRQARMALAETQEEEAPACRA